MYIQRMRDLHASLPKRQLLFFMGLAGAGKTFAGKFVADRLGFPCYDLDQDLTESIRLAVANGSPISEEMIVDYYRVILERIAALRQEHPRLVVMQAAYRCRCREMVTAANPDVQFVWVQASVPTIVRRLCARGDEITPEYAMAMMKDFEPPSDALVVVNEGDDVGALEGLARLLERP